MTALEATLRFRPSYLKMLFDRVDPRLSGAFGNRILIRPDYHGPMEYVFRATEFWCPYRPDKPSSLEYVRTFDIHGQMGVVDLRTVSPYLMVRLLNVRGTDYSEAGVYVSSGQKVTFTTVAIGTLPKLADGDEPDPGYFEGIQSIQAGPPLEPSFIASPPQAEVSAVEALRMGLRWARCLQA